MSLLRRKRPWRKRESESARGQKVVRGGFSKVVSPPKINICKSFVTCVYPRTVTVVIELHKRRNEEHRVTCYKLAID